MSDKDLMNRAPAGALAAAMDYGGDEGGGFENQTSADRSIPFLNVLQDLSPQTKKREASYVEGAEPGMMINTVTGEIFDGEQGLVIIPCFTEHCFTEWTPRDAGGGFKGKHATGSQIVVNAQAKAKDRKLKTDTGNDLVETFYVYALCFRPKVDLTKGTPETVADLIDINEMGSPVLLACTSTKITPYKKINTQLGMFCLPGLPHPKNKPPLWAFPLWLTTKEEKRPSGTSFNVDFKYAMGTKIQADKLLPRKDAEGNEFAVYSAARAFRDAVRGGAIKVDYNKQQGSAENGGSGKPEGEEDIPF